MESGWIAVLIPVGLAAEYGEVLDQEILSRDHFPGNPPAGQPRNSVILRPFQVNSSRRRTVLPEISYSSGYRQLSLKSLGFALRISYLLPSSELGPKYQVSWDSRFDFNDRRCIDRIVLPGGPPDPHEAPMTLLSIRI